MPGAYAKGEFTVAGFWGLGFGPLIYTKDNLIPLLATDGAQIRQVAHSASLW